MYAKCFDPDRLDEAHEYCRQSFIEAVRKRCPCIVVDNTNSLRCHYESYLRYAAEASYDSLIWEVWAVDQSDVRTFWKRNQHRTPENVAWQMWNAWEEDERALKLLPFKKI